MSDRDDIRQPLDHLPPAEERDPDAEIDQPHYPGTEAPAGESAVSPATTDPPPESETHDFDTRPPT